MSVQKVMFIRHGQTAFNQEGRLQGAMPVPINAAGREQSNALARYLRTRRLDAIYTSPRARTRETAEIIAAVLQLEVREDDRLSEIAFGAFEGYTFAEVACRFPEAFRKWESGYRQFRVPDGESRHDVQVRMRAAWDDIVGATDAEIIAIVGHSSATMILLASMFARLPDKPMRNTSITTLERFQDIWELAAFGEVPHLKE